MCLLNRQQLRELLRDEPLCRQFKFSDKELEILQLLSEYYTFEKIGKLRGVTRQRIQQVYCNAMQKIYKQMKVLIREHQHKT
jgi:DNA-directed RNA polymerase sigma subunit (sigma70/sigma32)